MSFENVKLLPNWNKTVDAATRFEELAVMARKAPEKFAHVIVGWSDDPVARKTSGYQVNYCLVGCGNDTMTLLGLVELVRDEIHIVTRRRS